MALFSVCSVYEGCRLVFLFYLFIYLLIVYGVLGLDVSGFHSICSVYKAFGLVLLVAFRVLVLFMGD